ncbi:MAG: AlpA family transcriptional regulator [Halieaceae bacterium]
MTNRLIRLPQVEAITGYKRSSIYRLVANNEFPAPVKIGKRASAWVEDEVYDWVTVRIQEARQ